MQRRQKVRLTFCVRALIYGAEKQIAAAHEPLAYSNVVDSRVFHRLYARRFLLPLRLALKASAFASELRRNGYLS